MDEVSVFYYGYVFDASGYGHAARAYIHALHGAGVELSVVNLSGNGRQVQDPLIESLIGRTFDADFHLFHGIPPQWARLAFRLRNAIGMTVWETDTMPSQWRNVLNHTLEVWLPCDFNVSVFSGALEKPIFKVPHPIFPSPNGATPHVGSLSCKLGVRDTDFVFYSIFEWQERKSPQGLLQSYLRAFQGEDPALLIIKTNPGAARLALQALESSRRESGSDARVEIRSEAWDEAQIEALHTRGDCYISLHRGEGWGYPLFEAASRGKPVIATNYSGPLDYLNPQEHLLVQCNPAPVRQPYLYYHPSMNWAEPDLTQATELMRWVYSNRESARFQAAKAATRIQRAYSVESIGAIARARLMTLLKQTDLPKWCRIARDRGTAHLRPAVPITGQWYDEDYFETGLKSNWDQGYTWTLFGQLFQETAAFLTGVFPEAASYLDVGCARGFLIRALRERSRECSGFDHSRWAIDRAEEQIKPLVTCVSVDEFNFDRQFDVLLALSVFESLTEQQAFLFLARARSSIRQALLAVIPCLENEQDQEFYAKADRDLSHITMRSRSWWHALFLKAGWRQDHLGNTVERICQNHELSKRMGWKVFVYAPG